MVSNGDESHVDNFTDLSSSMNNFTYQPLIPQTNLNIILTAVFARGISGSLTNNITIDGIGMQMNICMPL